MQQQLFEVKLLFFAGSKDIVGKGEISWECKDGSTVKELVNSVAQQYPKLNDIKRSMVVSVNLEYTAVDSPLVLKAGDEVAFIPPLSGG